MKERIDRLRELLRTAKDFREPWDYFHDELVHDPAFMRLGARRASRKLETTLAAIGVRLLGRDARLRSSVSLFIKELSFWHGSCAFGDHTGICFYFDDVDQGLLGLMKDIPSSYVLFARISLVALPRGAVTVGRGGQA